MNNGERIAVATSKLVGRTLSGEQVIAAHNIAFPNVKCYPSDAAGSLGTDGKLTHRGAQQYTTLALEYLGSNRYRVLAPEKHVALATGTRGRRGESAAQAEASIRAMLAEADSKVPAKK